MFRKSLTLTIATLAILCAFSVNAYAAKKTFDDLADEILTTLQSFHPVEATEMGIHSYDFLFTDYSSKSVKNMIKKLDKFEKELHGLRKTDSSRIEYKLIKANVDMALLDLKEIAWHKRSPLLYVDEAVNGVYFLLLSGHAPMQEKRVAILSRMREVPGLFATARKNLKKPPKVFVDAAVESLESGSLFYQQVAGQLMNEFPDEADNILKVATRAREAMNEFSIYLSEMALGDETSFAIGKKNLDYMLSHQYFLSYDSDSVLAIGEALLAEARQAYTDYEIHMAENHQNGQDSVFVPACISPEDILDYYTWETEQVRLFCVESGFVSIPDDIADVDVIETPPFLRSMIAGIAYQQAGPFDSSQQGYFYVRPVPRDMERNQLEARYRYVHRRGFKGSVAHEAYPGHHLQLQMAGRHENPIRKWQRNMMTIEGWALYCEQAIYEHGLFGEEDPAQWLAVLGGIRFRAARIVADVKLHTGQFSLEECVAWMIDVLNVDYESGREYIRKNVRSYTTEPTMPMSYLMGKREVMRLRSAAQARDGEAFSLNDFHDDLLAEGSIPPGLMWQALGLSEQ